MQKPIKFDLPLGDKIIQTIDELRANFNSDILPVFRQGLLTKWLYHRDRQAFEALRTLPTDLSDREIFWTIARLIKAQPAEMLIGDQTIRSLDDLTDNFTVEIVERYRSGELMAFLDKIGEADLNQKILAINPARHQMAIFEALCSLFGIEFDANIAELMFSQWRDASPASDSSPSNEPVSEFSLSDEEARQLVRENRQRNLIVHAATLSETAAEILIRHNVSLSWEWSIQPLSESLFPLQLTFTGLEYLRPEIAKILAKFPGDLAFNQLTELTFEAAQYLANRTGGLCLGQIKSLPFEVWTLFSEEQLFGIYPRFLDLPNLVFLDLATVRLLASFKGELRLGIPTLSMEIAEMLGQRSAKTVLEKVIDYPQAITAKWHLLDYPLYFPHLATLDRLTLEEARHLVSHTPVTGLPDYPGELTVSVTSLDFKVATELAAYKDRLIFNQLEHLTADVARALSKHKFQLRDNYYQIEMGSWLSFPALSQISRESMNYFVQGQINAFLAFDGLKDLALPLAKELIDYKQSTLHLNGLKQMEPMVAKCLASMEDVQLHLNGLQQLPPELAQAFCQGTGFICLFLGGIEHLEEKSRHLFQSAFPAYALIKGMQWYHHQARSRVMTILYPEFLGRNQPIGP